MNIQITEILRRYCFLRISICCSIILFSVVVTVFLIVVLSCFATSIVVVIIILLLIRIMIFLRTVAASSWWITANFSITLIRISFFALLPLLRVFVVFTIIQIFLLFRIVTYIFSVVISVVNIIISKVFLINWFNPERIIGLAPWIALINPGIWIKSFFYLRINHFWLGLNALSLVLLPCTFFMQPNIARPA